MATGASMRSKIKTVAIFMAVGLFAFFLYRIGFFDESTNNKRLVDILLPAPVKFNLMVAGIFGLLFITWGIFKRRMNKPK
jgi:hypothetical protein